MASFVLTSKIGLPRGLLLARWVLFVRQTLISPQSLFEHVIYKNLPSPDVVSWEQLDNWSRFPLVWHPPFLLAFAFAKTSNSTTRLPVNKKPFSSLLCLPSLSIITLGSSAFRLNRIRSFSRLSLSFRFRKQPLLSCGLTAAVLERLRDVSRCFQLRMCSRECAVQNRGMTLKEHCPW